MSLPRVTDILKAVGLGYPTAPNGWTWGREDEAMQRGKALHRVIEWYDAGKAMKPLHEEIEGGFSAYLKFRQEHEHIIWTTECELTHPDGWQGHLDRVGLLDGEPTVIDWKYPAKTLSTQGLRIAHWQTAAYKILWEEHTKELYGDASDYESAPVNRVVVELRRDGSYVLHSMTDDEGAMAVFRAAVTVYKAQARGEK
jgi:hypothetical protein